MTSLANAAVVELRAITKAFPGVVANDGIDLSLRAGEIHALLGENGAGKSTLMHVVSGMYRPDSGSIVVGGVPVEMEGPAHARALGIGMVYQHISLVPGFTVLENFMLGTPGAFRLDRNRARALYLELAVRLGADIDPEVATGKLPLGRQQQVEIIKVLASGVRVLILDEPTALLAPAEISDLQGVLRALRAQGMAIVFITHKLPEAVDVADRVTVLRGGRVAGALGPQDLEALSRAASRERIVKLMFGDEAAALGGMAEVIGPGERRHPPRELPQERILHVEGISTKSERREAAVREVSFSVRRGEIFGIAGVEGNGQRELAEALAGQRPVTAGRLVFAGVDITHTGVGERQRVGLRFVTDDRVGEGTVASLPVSLNLLLKRIGEAPFWSRTGRTTRAAVREAGEGLMREFDIRAPGLNTPCGTLSGGNLQKVVLGRELSFAPRLVVFNKPTQGLDAKTTLSLRTRIQRMAVEQDVAAVLISSDLEELVELCDRIGVMYQGRLTGVVENRGPGVEQRVGALMLGTHEEER